MGCMFQAFSLYLIIVIFVLNEKLIALLQMWLHDKDKWLMDGWIISSRNSRVRSPKTEGLSGHWHRCISIAITAASTHTAHVRPWKKKWVAKSKYQTTRKHLVTVGCSSQKGLNGCRTPGDVLISVVEKTPDSREQCPTVEIRLQRQVFSNLKSNWFPSAVVMYRCTPGPCDIKVGAVMGTAKHT